MAPDWPVAQSEVRLTWIIGGSERAGTKLSLCPKISPSSHDHPRPARPVRQQKGTRLWEKEHPPRFQPAMPLSCRWTSLVWLCICEMDQ